MKLKTLKLKNFRGYRNEVSVDIDDLTVFVGKNDIGKSTILEALDIFFNEGKGAVKMDKEDINKESLQNDDKNIEITLIFEQLPEEIVLDATNSTSLSAEKLPNSNGDLEILKRFMNAAAPKVFLRANHPSNEICNDLLSLKQTDLRNLIRENNIDCPDLSRNAVMRSSIWQAFNDDLRLEEVELDVSKGDAKNIWDKLKNSLPLYSLFQSDRKNSDTDSEVQDPLQYAIKDILNDKELRIKLDGIAKEVSSRLDDVAKGTLEKLKEMNSDIASSLDPVIPAFDSLPWKDVFKKVSISGDNNIPINKRGSGIKRLILLNFFRAEAERRRDMSDVPSVIYAIEEPETSQHADHQRILIEALKSLSGLSNSQVILTTHSSYIVKQLKFKNLRLIKMTDDDKMISSVEPNQLPYPSLNEVNFTAFNEVTEEYHNELYGYIESMGSKNEYCNGKARMEYLREFPNGRMVSQQITLTEYIRHQIHHPENTNNEKYNNGQLRQSINEMRSFLLTQTT